MPIPIETLAGALTPSSTILFLGAGAVIQSGGPTGEELAKFIWQELAKNDEQPSDDLIEVSSILEYRYGGRIPLVNAVRQRLSNLAPTGGLLVLPSIQFKAIHHQL
jgi:hypothetical protein